MATEDGPVIRRVKAVYVPNKMGGNTPSPMEPMRRIMIRLDDGSYLDASEIEIRAICATGYHDTVEFIIKNPTTVIFYDPDEVNW